MSSLDIQYVAELVKQAQEGDSNAFAELYAATCESQYAFALRLLKDEFLAHQALQDTYTEALKMLFTMREPALVVFWLNRLMMQSCYKIKAAEDGENVKHALSKGANRMVTVGTEAYSVRQIMTLPLGESQTILLSKLCGMKNKAVADLLEVRGSEVRRYLQSGIRRLKMLTTESAGEGK